MEKKLFIGIDFSKMKVDVTILEKEHTNETRYSCFSNDESGFEALLNWIKQESDIPSSDWLFCGEDTGLYSIGLSNYLCQRNLFMWLDSSLQIKRSIGLQRGKNDRLDSKVIAFYAFRFQDRARRYAPKNETLEALQVLLSFRTRILRNKNALLVSAVELRKMRGEDNTTLYVYNQTLTDIEQMNKEIKEIEKKMKEYIKENEEVTRNYTLVTSIKGISLLNAVAILIATNNFTRFNSCREFACFCGVVPFERSSGSSVHGKSQVSRFANIKIKTLLTQAAKCAIVYDNELKAYYHRKIKEGKHKNVVINNVRNKLVHRIFAVVRKQEMFDPDYLNKLACAS